MKGKDEREAKKQREKGFIAYKEKNYREAADYLEEAAHVLEDFDLLARLADAYSLLKEHQKSIEAYTKLYRMAGKEINDSHVIIMARMADEALRLNRGKLGLEYIDKAIGLLPLMRDKIRAQELKKVLAEKKQEMIDFEKRPEDEALDEILKQGKVMEERKCYSEAIELYTKYLSMEESGVVLYRRAECYKEVRRFEEAVEGYLKCLRPKSDLNLECTNNCYYSLATCYLEMPNFEEAIKACERALNHCYNSARRKKMENCKKLAEERQKVCLLHSK
eukprot:TRINITY_DN9686_c0_g7_i4.p1 TRINITY_DN9686_c0_g7~~TRINITY_DN9686_c0_g7_i4.p1  ORF type:complete len:305 (-),score=93.39 TRINITY_DN9686_c0_g7_i4:286-1116(-)